MRDGMKKGEECSGTPVRSRRRHRTTSNECKIDNNVGEGRVRSVIPGRPTLITGMGHPLVTATHQRNVPTTPVISSKRGREPLSVPNLSSAMNGTNHRRANLFRRASPTSVGWGWWVGGSSVAGTVRRRRPVGKVQMWGCVGQRGGVEGHPVWQCA